MDSVRYPGKAMVKIKNFPMIEHVYRRAKLIKEIEEVIVTTCDDIIYDYCLQKKINITILTHKLDSLQTHLYLKGK